MLGDRYESTVSVMYEGSGPRTSRASKQRQKPSWQVKEEQEFDKCTFKPNINKRNKSRREPLRETMQNTQYITGYQQTVQRMRQADQERKYRNDIMNE